MRRTLQRACGRSSNCSIRCQGLTTSSPFISNVPVLFNLGGPSFFPGSTSFGLILPSPTASVDALPQSQRLLQRITTTDSLPHLAAIISVHRRSLQAPHILAAACQAAHNTLTSEYAAWNAAPPIVRTLMSTLATATHGASVLSPQFTAVQAAALLSACTSLHMPAEHAVVRLALGQLADSPICALRTLPATVLAQCLRALASLHLPQHPLWARLEQACFKPDSSADLLSAVDNRLAPHASKRRRFDGGREVQTSATVELPRAAVQQQAQLQAQQHAAPCHPQPTQAGLLSSLNTSQLVAVAHAYGSSKRLQSQVFAAVAERAVLAPGTFGLEEVQDALWAAEQVSYVHSGMLDAIARKLARYLSLLEPSSCRRIMASYASLGYRHANLQDAIAGHVASAIHSYSLDELVSLTGSLVAGGSRHTNLLTAVANVAVAKREDLRPEHVLQLAVAYSQLRLNSKRLFGVLSSKATRNVVPRCSPEALALLGTAMAVVGHRNPTFLAAFCSHAIELLAKPAFQVPMSVLGRWLYTMSTLQYPDQQLVNKIAAAVLRYPKRLGLQDLATLSRGFASMGCDVDKLVYQRISEDACWLAEQPDGGHGNTSTLLVGLHRLRQHATANAAGSSDGENSSLSSSISSAYYDSLPSTLQSIQAVRQSRLGDWHLSSLGMLSAEHVYSPLALSVLSIEELVAGVDVISSSFRPNHEQLQMQQHPLSPPLHLQAPQHASMSAAAATLSSLSGLAWGLAEAKQYSARTFSALAEMTAACISAAQASLGSSSSFMQLPITPPHLWPALSQPPDLQSCSNLPSADVSTTESLSSPHAGTLALGGVAKSIVHPSLSYFLPPHVLPDLAWAFASHSHRSSPDAVSQWQRLAADLTAPSLTTAYGHSARLLTCGDGASRIHLLQLPQLGKLVGASQRLGNVHGVHYSCLRGELERQLAVADVPGVVSTIKALATTHCSDDQLLTLASQRLQELVVKHPRTPASVFAATPLPIWQTAPVSDKNPGTFADLKVDPVNLSSSLRVHSQPPAAMLAHLATISSIPVPHGFAALLPAASPQSSSNAQGSMRSMLGGGISQQTATDGSWVGGPWARVVPAGLHGSIPAAHLPLMHDACTLAERGVLLAGDITAMCVSLHTMHCHHQQLSAFLLQQTQQLAQNMTALQLLPVLEHFASRQPQEITSILMEVSPKLIKSMGQLDAQQLQQLATAMWKVNAVHPPLQEALVHQAAVRHQPSLSLLTSILHAAACVHTTSSDTAVISPGAAFTDTQPGREGQPSGSQSTRTSCDTSTSSYSSSSSSLHNNWSLQRSPPADSSHRRFLPGAAPSSGITVSRLKAQQLLSEQEAPHLHSPEMDWLVHTLSREAVTALRRPEDLPTQQVLDLYGALMAASSSVPSHLWSHVRGKLGLDQHPQQGHKQAVEDMKQSFAASSQRVTSVQFTQHANPLGMAESEVQARLASPTTALQSAQLEQLTQLASKHAKQGWAVVLGILKHMQQHLGSSEGDQRGRSGQLAQALAEQPSLEEINPLLQILSMPTVRSSPPAHRSAVSTMVAALHQCLPASNTDVVLHLLQQCASRGIVEAPVLREIDGELSFRYLHGSLDQRQAQLAAVLFKDPRLQFRQARLLAHMLRAKPETADANLARASPDNSMQLRARPSSPPSLTSRQRDARTTAAPLDELANSALVQQLLLPQSSGLQSAEANSSIIDDDPGSRDSSSDNLHVSGWTVSSSLAPLARRMQAMAGRSAAAVGAKARLLEGTSATPVAGNHAMTLPDSTARIVSVAQPTVALLAHRADPGTGPTGSRAADTTVARAQAQSHAWTGASSRGVTALMMRCLHERLDTFTFEQLVQISVALHVRAETSQRLYGRLGQALFQHLSGGTTSHTTAHLMQLLYAFGPRPHIAPELLEEIASRSLGLLHAFDRAQLLIIADWLDVLSHPAVTKLGSAAHRIAKHGRGDAHQAMAFAQAMQLAHAQRLAVGAAAPFPIMKGLEVGKPHGSLPTSSSRSGGRASNGSSSSCPEGQVNNASVTSASGAGAYSRFHERHDEWQQNRGNLTLPTALQPAALALRAWAIVKGEATLVERQQQLQQLLPAALAFAGVVAPREAAKLLDAMCAVDVQNRPLLEAVLGRFHLARGEVAPMHIASFATACAMHGHRDERWLCQAEAQLLSRDLHPTSPATNLLSAARLRQLMQLTTAFSQLAWDSPPLWAALRRPFGGFLSILSSVQLTQLRDALQCVEGRAAAAAAGDDTLRAANCVPAATNVQPPAAAGQGLEPLAKMESSNAAMLQHVERLLALHGPRTKTYRTLSSLMENDTSSVQDVDKEA